MDEREWAAPERDVPDVPMAEVPIAATSGATSGSGSGSESRSGSGSESGSESSSESSSESEAVAMPVPPRPIRLPLALRPMTMSDLLDGSFAVIKARPATVFTVAASILIPFHLLAAFLQRGIAGYVLGAGFNPSGSSGSTVGNRGASVLSAYLGTALLSLAPFFLGGALAALVVGWYLERDLSAGEALRAMWRRAPALFGAYLVLLPLKVLGFAVCMLGAIPVVTLSVLTAPSITIEGLGPIAGARRSWQLVRRRFWHSAAVVVVASVGAYILNLVFGVGPQVLSTLAPQPFGWLARGLVQAAVSMVVTTALVSVAVLMYLDLRIRSEGLDLELGAAEAFGDHA